MNGYSPRRLNAQVNFTPAQTDNHHLDAITDHDGFIFPSSENQHLRVHLSKRQEDPAKQSRHWLAPGLLRIINLNQPSAPDAHRFQPARSVRRRTTVSDLLQSLSAFTLNCLEYIAIGREKQLETSPLQDFPLQSLSITHHHDTDRGLWVL